MRGDRMYQRTNNYLRRFGRQDDSVICRSRCGWPHRRYRHKNLRASCLASLLLFTFTLQPVLAQGKSPEPVKQIRIADIPISESLPPQESSALIAPVPEAPAPMAPAQTAPRQVVPAPMTPAPMTPSQEPQSQVSPARRPITIS